jgi:ubiquinone/menaquinone biosynthesis C-methylase UbiE
MGFDKKKYEKVSFGVHGIKEDKDLPNLKLRYCMEMIKGRKKKNAKLLEIGCGAGRILTSIRERDQHINLSGIDLSHSQIKEAKGLSKGKNINFYQGNCEKLPFKSNSFDYVIIMDLLEHIDHPERALAEVQRVLKKGGQLYASVPAEGTRGSIYWISEKIFRKHFKEIVVGHIQRYRIKDIENLVAKAKLSKKQEYYSYHILGSLMDYTLWALLMNKKLAKLFWAKNKYYMAQAKPSAASRIFNAILSLGNAIAYYESTMLKKRRTFATNVHIVAQKRST